MTISIGRRELITALGGAAVWPLAARAQQTAMPVVAYLGQGTTEATAAYVAAVRGGIGEAGLIEGKDFTFDLKLANNDVDRVPALASDLVQRRVAVIVAQGLAAARAAKAATTEIPIIFTGGADPVQVGLVASLNHPGGNVTGISSMNYDIGSKVFGLLHELLPAAKRFAILVDIGNPEAAKSAITSTQRGALSLGLQVEVLFASNEREIDAAFDGLGARAQALIIQSEAAFLQFRAKMAALAIREKLPALSNLPDFPKLGGLISYGSSFLDAHRQAGIYAGRILKGENPGDLPVQQATKFDLVINLKTAKALGLIVPQSLLATADEVIE